jgi:hypothetical protein
LVECWQIDDFEKEAAFVIVEERTGFDMDLAIAASKFTDWTAIGFINLKALASGPFAAVVASAPNIEAFVAAKAFATDTKAFIATVDIKASMINLSTPTDYTFTTNSNTVEFQALHLMVHITADTVDSRIAFLFLNL